jgi:hypothetical protein
MTENMTESWPEHVKKTAVYFPYPPTPDIAGAVQQRLRPQPTVNKQWRWAVALALFVVLLAASLLAIPPVRAAVMEWLRIGAIEIFVVEEVPALETAVPISIIDVGEPLTLAEAQAIFPEPLHLPSDWDRSGTVYSHRLFGEMPVMTMQWQTADGVTVTLSQIAAPYLGMKWASGEQVVEMAVHGKTAVWIEGSHPLQFETGNFDRHIIVDSNVLIWTEGTVTYRLEGQLTQETAVYLAESSIHPD